MGTIYKGQLAYPIPIHQPSVRWGLPNPRSRNGGVQSVRFNIELELNPEGSQPTPPPKTFVAAVTKVIRSHKLKNRVALQCFGWHLLREVQNLVPVYW